MTETVPICKECINKGDAGPPYTSTNDACWFCGRKGPHQLFYLTDKHREEKKKKEAAREEHDRKTELKQLKDGRLPALRKKKTDDNKHIDALIKKTRDRIVVLETKLSLIP